MTTVVLVHGAWHGAWSWSGLEAALAERGVASRTVELPSVGTDPSRDLVGDAEAVRAAVREVGGPVVLVAHSYGGMVVTEAAAGLDGVVRLVYLTAFVPDVGQSLLDLVDYGPLTWIVPAGEGLLGVATGEEVDLFYGDVPADQAAAAALRLRPQAAASFGQPVTAAAWRDVPSTYVVCTEDRCIPAAAQRAWAERCTEVVELASSHSPFLSRPGEVAELLAARLTPSR